MRKFLVLHILHARVHNFKQFSIENFIQRVFWAKVSAKNFQEPFYNFWLYRQTKWWREIQDVFTFPFGLFIFTSVIFQIVLFTSFN